MLITQKHQQNKTIQQFNTSFTLFSVQLFTIMPSEDILKVFENMSDRHR